MKLFTHTLFVLLMLTQICYGQWKEITDSTSEQIIDDVPLRIQPISHTPDLKILSLHPSFYDRKSEWQTIIKQFLGPGESLSEKLITFDLYQEFIRANNATFLWNSINWDSLAAALRLKINDSTSRGEFSRILNDLAFALKDGHASAYSNYVYFTPLNPGTPILADGGGFIYHFGAGLTPLADSSLLVYKAVPNHPLGLVPGDIILGYQGVPWSQIVRELLIADVPHTLLIGASPSSLNRILLWAAGESWHMFDTIDVVKYATGITEHLPLDPMLNLSAPSNMINNEQLPVPGVPMPVINNWNSGAVTYGIIDGTNIGYIYVYHHAYEGVSSEFDAAVQALMETDGLIIDIRLDWGGAYGLNMGISRLINYSTSTMDVKVRCSPNDLFSLCPSNPPFWNGEIPNDVGTFYDRPIAMLLGPNCHSYGDISAWQFTYVPNARMFGRSPKAIYSGLSDGPSRAGYTLLCPTATLVDHYNPEIPRWGQEFPLFEEVWLTPDGVANGEDDVVNRALEWMNNLVYPHNITVDKTYYVPGLDSVDINTTIENPNSHQISAVAYLKSDAGVVIDSVNLSPVLFKPTGEQWYGSIDLPALEDFYNISVTAIDQTNLEQFSMPHATRFTTAGPLKLDSLAYIKGITNYYSVKPFVKNNGTSLTITNAKLRLYCDDPWVTSVSATVVSLGPIAPGATVGGNTWIAVNYDPATFPGYFNLRAEISRDGHVHWLDSTQLIITGVEAQDIQSLTYKLSQNYPNPFNPSTTFRYSIPTQSKVVIKVYDILGNEIATLMNEEKSVGTYELTWNATTLPSGVYFYQLRSGDFIDTKKMLLLK